MVLALKIKKEFAENARQFLLRKGWLACGISIGRSAQRYVLLPLNKKAKTAELKKRFAGSSIVERNLKPLPPAPGNLKRMLRGILPESKINALVRSYDVVGDICILEIPKSLEKFELTIGHAVKRAFPSIKVVAKKAGKRTEVERVMPLKIITGERRLFTEYREHGVVMKVDLSKVYFSPRASHERLRIAQLVKKGENVLVMFGGVAPYALVIAKFQPNCRVWSIELNPEAHKLAEENIRINRAGHIVTAVQGPVSKVMPKLGLVFDRIIMPFPEKSWNYLALALKYAAPNSVVHFMVFVNETKIAEAKKRILKIAKESGREAKVVNWRLFGSYAPRINRYTFDIFVR